MSKWHLHIPHRDRDDRLVDVAAMGREAGLDREQRTILRELTAQAMVEDGLSSAGELIDKIDRANHDERRRMLDTARQRAGLETTEAIDAHRRFEDLQRGLLGKTGRDLQGRAWLTCAEPNCGAYPVNEATGAPAQTNVRRWWCSQHRDQAEPGDMKPWTLRLQYAPSGCLQYIDDVEAERARMAARQKHRDAEAEARQAERRVEGEQLHRGERAWLEANRPANLTRPKEGP